MRPARCDVLLIGGVEGTRSNISVDDIGSKAFNLARMASAGLRIPPALVLGTEFSREGWGVDPKKRGEIAAVLRSNLGRLEDVTDLKLGSNRRPLIVSVRSGAPVSMPGMMATILDVGVTDRTVHGLVRRTGNPALAWDAYRRFVEGYGELVGRIPLEQFRTVAGEALADAGARSPRELDSLRMRDLATFLRNHYETSVGTPLPQNPFDQLVVAVEAVFASWHSHRAQRYRALHGIADELGTAVIIQQMVFGNAGGLSGSGVGFTRNPASGANELYVDFLPNAQGEDVVSGRHVVHVAGDLDRVAPGLATELESVRRQLETEFGDLQDFEFTLEDGRLYLLQTRSAQRTPWAALRVAIDLVHEGRITPARALEMLQPYDVEHVTRSRLAAHDRREGLARGVPASGGIATGRVALDAERAVHMAATGRQVILVREDTDTDDIDGFVAAAGVLTARGGRTSHAAVVTRQLGKPCVVGCTELQIDWERRQCSFASRVVQEGAVISLDGESGVVYEGEVEIITERPDEAIEIIRSWREKHEGCPAGLRSSSFVSSDTA